MHQKGLQFYHLQKEVDATVKMLSLSANNANEYEIFKQYYAAMLETALSELLIQASSPEDKTNLQKNYESLLTEEFFQKAYQAASNIEQQQAVQETENYIRSLGRQIYEQRKTYSAWAVRMAKEALPLFGAAGLLEEDVKAWAVSVLRQEIQTHMYSCRELGWVPGLLGKGNKKAEECEEVLKAASALIVLGEEGNSADAQLIGDLLEQGYNGVLAPSLIMLVSSGLITMGGEDILVAKLHEIAHQQPRVGLFGRDFSFVSFQDWVKAAQSLYYGGDWAVGHEYSFYQNPNGNGLGNVWMDLGEYLGGLSCSSNEEGQRAQEVLDRLAGQLLVVGESGFLTVQFPVFMAGALAGGYRIRNMARFGWELDGSGKGHYTDTRPNWQALQERVQKWGESITGYAIAQLYFAGKFDLDPYTKLDVENRLAAGYKKSGKGQIKEIVQRSTPSDKELSQYQGWKTASRVAGYLDYALMVVGLVTAVIGVVKAGVSGVQALNQMGRAFKVARAGAAGNGIKATAISYNRVLRLGRIRKYGTSSWRQVLIGKMSGVATLAQEPVWSYGAKVLPGVPQAAVKPITPVAAKTPASVAQILPETKAASAAPKQTILKRGQIFTPDIEKQLYKQGGERLVQTFKRHFAVEEKPTAAPLKKNSKAARKARAKAKAQKLQADAPAVLVRTDTGFLSQRIDVLLGYLRNTYKLTPDALKDIKQVLLRAETLSDGKALKKAVFERVEQLLEMKADIIKAYASSTGRPQVRPGIRIYYLGNKETVTAASFVPKHITLAFEEVLYPGTLKELPNIASRINASRSPWAMHTKGTANIAAESGKRITTRDAARLYQDILNCSPTEPCRYILDKNGTILLYPPQGRIWLRVGEHEVANKFHLHLHTDKYLPVTGGIRNGQERVILNYRIPISGLERSFRVLARPKGKNSSRLYIPVQNTVAYQTLVSGALEEMVRSGAAVGLP